MAGETRNPMTGLGEIFAGAVIAATLVTAQNSCNISNIYKQDKTAPGFAQPSKLELKLEDAPGQPEYARNKKQELNVYYNKQMYQLKEVNGRLALIEVKRYTVTEKVKQ